MNFTESLVQYLRNVNLVDTEFYAESSPVPKDITPNIVVIASQGETGGDLNRLTRIETKRFVVSGSDVGALAKAEQIISLLVPEDNNTIVGFYAGEFAVYSTFFEKRPSFASNINNIFFADFTIRFLIAKG